DGAPGAYTPCGSAADCPPSNACVVARCDDTRKVCVYDQCPAAPGTTCSALACDYSTLTCATSATSYGFHAADIKLPAGNVGCNGSATRCFAASYPFVFVGTATAGV